ncbi:hypothetical protein VSS37_11930 [Candidatus Thiothrix sp. Deng01]|uniref:Tetratricopeptide repeat protein n=1 Tax=Candidatus Thiothrix phosphatis TaxID=3112415 RepID=A0ABU6CXX8_9GAMM|nr:hypothetical protein [Candidatus Thiothrix sp. Deng01]MEB4591691.1 hypothetical protein [Candidatus Thiothrix sp. Deng01]
MATRDELKDQASGCTDAASCAALAKQALAEPADLDYAKELLEKGESYCSFPDHYVSVAEGYVAAGDKDKAAALYEEAAGSCFDAKEKAQVGYSIALHLGDKDKGRALLEEAIGETSNTNELLSFAAYVQEALQDNALANKLFGKVTGNCKTIADYRKLAAGIKAEGNENAARMVFKKAEPSSNDTQDVVEYATGLKDMFGDDAAVESALNEAEGGCMFPAQFVALAGGFMKLLGNKDKAEELLENGKNFAMSGEENLDLATGYASLLGDQPTASELYNNALSEFSTKDDLLKLASQAAANMDDKSIAGKAYDKLASKLNTVADLSMLAKAVNGNLGDKDKTAAIYAAAEAKADTASALVSLAGEVNATLQDADKANALYSKAVGTCKVYTDSVSVLDALAKSTPDAALASDALHKALDLAETNAQVLDVAQRAQKLGNNSVAIQALDKAEANVSSLDEMRKLAIAAKQLAADDAERNSRIADKLAKREASQARYVEFQNQEKTLTKPNQFIDLAGKVAEELDDASYATQLLTTAEEKMQATGSFSFAAYQPLILAVGNLVKDKAWLARLLDLAASNAGTFAQVRSLGETVCKQLADSDFGKTWTQKFYGDQLAKLESGNASAFELKKLANAVKEHLGDDAQAQQILDKAEAKAENHFHFAYLAELAQKWGDSAKAGSLYDKAAAACQNSSQFKQLADLMQKAGAANDAVSSALNATKQQASGKGHYW